MRIRLTRNLDKDRGFVNGNLGTVESKLRPDVFVVKTMQDVLILVHPITVKGYKFIPACYAYATTMRRAQGATLEAACLYFDRSRPDRGYAEEQSVPTALSESSYSEDDAQPQSTFDTDPEPDTSDIDSGSEVSMSSNVSD